VNTLEFLYFSGRTCTRKTEAAKPTAAAVVAESGSRKFSSDGEEIIRDRVPVPQLLTKYYLSV
jgi:hypothetical protein